MVNIGICIVRFVRFDYRRVYNWSEALEAYSIVPSLSKLILQIKLKIRERIIMGHIMHTTQFLQPHWLYSLAGSEIAGLHPHDDIVYSLRT
jgi:hypothetical protein